jgi:hypothetical protein
MEQMKPMKGMKEMQPMQPMASLSWSELAGEQFFETYEICDYGFA